MFDLLNCFPMLFHFIWETNTLIDFVHLLMVTCHRFHFPGSTSLDHTFKPTVFSWKTCIFFLYNQQKDYKI